MFMGLIKDPKKDLEKIKVLLPSGAPLIAVGDLLDNEAFDFTIVAGTRGDISCNFFAKVSIISGTISITFGSNNLILFATRNNESLIHTIAPADNVFNTSLLKQ